MICFELLYQLRVYACPNGLRKQDEDPHANRKEYSNGYTGLSMAEGRWWRVD